MKAAKKLGWMLDTSTPGVPQKNAIAERGVRTVKELGRCSMFRSGTSYPWWERAAPDACFLKNSAGDESPYFLKHGKHSKHKLVPFGALVDFMPTPNPNKDPATFDKKVLTGWRAGFHCHPGGEWSGDYYVAEFDAFRINPDAEPKDVTIHRTAELIIPPGGYVPYFPLAEYRQRQRRIMICLLKSSRSCQLARTTAKLWIAGQTLTLRCQCFPTFVVRGVSHRAAARLGRTKGLPVHHMWTRLCGNNFIPRRISSSASRNTLIAYASLVL